MQRMPVAQMQRDVSAIVDVAFVSERPASSAASISSATAPRDRSHWRDEHGAVRPARGNHAPRDGPACERMGFAERARRSASSGHERGRMSAKRSRRLLVRQRNFPRLAPCFDHEIDRPVLQVQPVSGEPRGGWVIHPCTGHVFSARQDSVLNRFAPSACAIGTTRSTCPPILRVGITRHA
jgi:hypothetical protein